MSNQHKLQTTNFQKENLKKNVAPYILNNGIRCSVLHLIKGSDRSYFFWEVAVEFTRFKKPVLLISLIVTF